MKGYAALITLGIFSYFYVSSGGYESLKEKSHATYESKEVKGVLQDSSTYTDMAADKIGDFILKAREVVAEKANTAEFFTKEEVGDEKKNASHIKTPANVKAIYMTSWVAGTPSIRDKVVRIIDTTEINSVVIDVKDNTGAVSWNGRVKDLEAFVKTLHDKNIYVIARISVFQDPLYVKAHPELAVRNKVTGEIWRDNKGMPWIDTGSKEMWDYTLEISTKAYEMGFDEINLDYIRFPTDGKISDMVFPISGDRAKFDKKGIVKEFFTYINEELDKVGVPVSGDVFGIITITRDDIPTLGQDLHDAYEHFDYVAPMVYPSHFSNGTGGYTNPAANPGAIINLSMLGALVIADNVASSTGQTIAEVRAKLRPWYQDFDMGATYTKELVRAQIDAGEKLGVNSWMLWDPSNTYTVGALLPE